MSYTHRTRALDELLERVAKLEKQNAELQKQIKDLRKYTEEECYVLWEFLQPVLFKAFPGYVPTVERINEVLNQPLQRRQEP